MKRINIAIDDRTGKYFVPDDSPNDDYFDDEDEQFISNRKDFKTVETVSCKWLGAGKNLLTGSFDY